MTSRDALPDFALELAWDSRLDRPGTKLFRKIVGFEIAHVRRETPCRQQTLKVFFNVSRSAPYAAKKIARVCSMPRRFTSQRPNSSDAKTTQQTSIMLITCPTPSSVFADLCTSSA